MNYTITGKDTFTLYDRLFTDFVDGDNITLTFPNNIAESKTGKNQNTIFSRNYSGDNGEVILRMLRGSADDKFLQEKLSTVNDDFASFELADGEFVKRLGDGATNVTRDIHSLIGGMFQKRVEAKENSEGDTEQGVAIYTFMFAQVKRSMM